MAVYNVTPETLRTMAGTLDTLRNEYENLYRNNLLSNLVEGTLREAYEGTDAEALVKRLKEYELAFNKMRDKMKEYAEFLRTTATTYEDAANTYAAEAATIGKGN